MSTDNRHDPVTPILFSVLLVLGGFVVVRMFPEYLPFANNSTGDEPEKKVGDLFSYLMTSGLAVFSFLGVTFTKDKWGPMLMYAAKYLLGIIDKDDKKEDDGKTDITDIIEDFIDDKLDDQPGVTPVDGSWRKYKVRGTIELAGDSKTVVNKALDTIIDAVASDTAKAAPKKVTKPTVKKLPAKPKTTTKTTKGKK